jgi:hypothetical protein
MRWYQNVALTILRLRTSRRAGVLLEYVLITLLVVTPLVGSPLAGLHTGDVSQFGFLPRWFAYRWQTIMRGIALPIP